MDGSVKEKIMSIIKQETGTDLLGVDPNRDFLEQISLDSMQFVVITSKVEEELNIDLPITVMGISTLNEFFDAIEKELSQEFKTV